jgi:ribose-phosphate pyrophosphokinase
MTMNDTPIKLFSGRSNRPLAERIAQHIGIPLGECLIDNFSDGEVWVKYGENIRGCDVFIIQSTQQPAENMLELLIMIDAARRASAKRVTAVIPYFGYARQDRKDQPRVSITAKLVANLITSSGADRVISMDLHAPQIQGFFDIPFDHLYSSVVFINMFPPEQYPNLVVVSPDVGGIKMARAFAKRLGADLVVLDKRRNRANESEVMNVIGNVEGKNVLLVDDIIDTGGTFTNASLAVLEKGATAVYGACTHPVFSGQAAERIVRSRIAKMIVTDSIPLHENIAKTGVVEVRSVAELFGEAISRTHNHQSITSLFDIDKS